ncbi:MAG: hypothetical protein ACR2QC_00505 [Gammaproteobacteria bacterium]
MSAKTKSTAIPAKAGISFTLIFRINHPSHSCEGRNLRRRKAAGNCTSLQFALSARGFLLSKEWDGGAGMGQVVRE